MPGQLVKRPVLTTKAVPSWWEVVTVRWTVMECDMTAGHRSRRGHLQADMRAKVRSPASKVTDDKHTVDGIDSQAMGYRCSIKKTGQSMCRRRLKAADVAS